MDFQTIMISSFKSTQNLRTRHVFYVLFFIIGLSLGMVSSLFLKSFSLTLQITTSHSSSSSPPSELLIEMDTSRKYSSRVEFGLMHDMSDEELLMKASSMVSSIDEDRNVAKKVAFMFLTTGTIPLAPLWEKFFEGHLGFYTIYVHPHPYYNDSWPPGSVFFARRIPSQEVYWGTATMIDAERRLLANALLNKSNERFVLLSESCIPLFDFKKTYDYLMNSNLSFLSSFDDPRKAGRGRYNPNMWPNINVTDWRKGSQWFELSRELAIHIVSDRKYYKLFEQHCHPPCYMDEHYIPTMVNILHPQMASNRSVTWVDWSRGGPHPGKFGWGDITDEFLNCY